MIDILLRNFYKNFAAETAERVIANGDMHQLYLLATGDTPLLTKPEKEKAVFRAAYVLEYIYFTERDLFAPYKERFFTDFPKTTNSSAKRHFTKMMRHLLEQEKPDKEHCHKIAEAAATWIIEPKTRVAVKIGAVEVLRVLRDEVEWVDELLPQILEQISQEASPGIIVRLKRWKTKKALH